jgi:HAD superfamily hydrolase (TIGR01450 family)
MTASAVVIDLDGVVWLAGDPLPGAGEAVALLDEVGIEVLFATNNSAPVVDVLLERLRRAGIVAHPAQVVTAAQAAAWAAAPGTSALLLGEEGLEEAARARGLSVLGAAVATAPDAVIVGWCRQFDFQMIAAAASAVRSGARFIATNDDPTHPTPDGLLPGTGALVAAIATAAEAHPLIAGKPGDPMVDLIRQRAPDVSLVIGDRPSTDGALARRLGAPFGLVVSEATPRDAEEAEFEAPSLLDVVQAFLA